MSLSRLRAPRVPFALLAALTLGAPACITGEPVSPDAAVSGPSTPGTSGEKNDAGSAKAQAPGTDGSTVALPDGSLTVDSAATSTPAADAGKPKASGDASAPKPGSGYQIDLSETSVSGFSSGAFFAVQFHVAFSSILKGAAIFAGGPYDCAQGSANTAETTCLTGSPDAASLVTVTKQNYAAGTIDNPANLMNERVFLFGGADDSVVDPSVVDSLNTYYGAFMGASSIQYVSRHPGTAHTMPTMSYGGTCDSVVSPFVGDCSYDGAGSALKQIYGALSPAATTLGGKMLSFSQTTFVPDAATEGMADTGYYYVPAACANGETCRVHISFHGCEQNAALVNDAYYGHAGYNEWADTNHIIVLYPQATSSSGNDYECWDFWGYDGASYSEKSGTQLAAVRAMLGWIAAGGQSDAGATGSDASTSTPTPTTPGLSFDASLPLTGASCVTASNTAQVAAGRAYVTAGIAYATGSGAYLGADNASTSSSLEEVTTGYYIACL